MNDFSQILSNLRVIEPGTWTETILNLKNIPKTFFVESTPEMDPLSRLNSITRLYAHRQDPWAFIDSISSTKKCQFKLSTDSSIEKMLSSVEKQFSNDDSIARHLPKISIIFEEMAMNGLTSSLKSVEKNGMQAASLNPNAEIFFILEGAAVWIHCIDHLGAFKKKYFTGSFKEYDGSQGFGMKLIFESASDLFISSITNKHTWFAAKVSTYLSNMKYDKELKALCLDCPND